MEKKEIKISVSTLIILVIALILLVAVVIMGIHIANQNKALEASQVALENKEQETVKKEDTTNKVSNQTTNTNQNNVTELNENDAIVQKLMKQVKVEGYDTNGVLEYKNDVYRAFLHKNKSFNDEVKLMYGLMDLYYSDYSNDHSKFFDESANINGAQVFSSNEIKNAIINRFGSNVKYTDKSYGRMNLDDFEYFFGGMGPITYEQGNYYVHGIYAGGGGGDFSIAEKISKILKYDNKIEIYVKAGYEYLNINGLGEGEIFEMDENQIKAAGVTMSIYKDYNFNTNTPENKLIEIPGWEEDIDTLLNQVDTTVLNQLDTYVYTFELDNTNGEYYLSAFNKV